MPQQPTIISFADALKRIPIGRVVAATAAAQATTWCYHPRHGHPCPLPCSICEEECGQQWRATCGQGEAEDLLRAAKAATHNERKEPTP